MSKDDVVIDLSGDDSEIAEVPQVLVSKWTPSDVSAWLCRIGYNEYSVCINFIFCEYFVEIKN